MRIESSKYIQLPVNKDELAIKISDFQAAPRHLKKQTDWFIICASSEAFMRWNRKCFYGTRLNQDEFAALAARSYEALFGLSIGEIPHCVPSIIVKISNQADKLLESLPQSSILPGHAKNDIFLRGLNDLSQWTVESIPYGVTGKGKPELRWMVGKIAEEFSYSFVQKPNVSIIGDIVRIGWPSITDRSIRNTATQELLTKAFEKSELKRNNDNQTNVNTSPNNSRLFSRNIPQNTSNTPNQIIIPPSASGILEAILTLAKQLPDLTDRRRISSIINAILIEYGNPHDDEGN